MIRIRRDMVLVATVDGGKAIYLDCDRQFAALRDFWRPLRWRLKSYIVRWGVIEFQFKGNIAQVDFVLINTSKCRVPI